MTDYLGLNTGGHDSSVAYLKVEGGNVAEVVIHLSERALKIKHQGGFPFRALEALKKWLGKTWDEIPYDNIAINSYGKHPRILEDELSIHERVIIESRGLTKVTYQSNENLSFVTHHLAHAFSSLFQCPYKKALIIVSDGAGNKARDFDQDHSEVKLGQVDPDLIEHLTVYEMEDGKLTPILKKYMFCSPTSDLVIQSSAGLGKIFEETSKKIFGSWTQVGKVMGLSAYGKPEKISNPDDLIQILASQTFLKVEDKASFDNQPSDEFSKKANLASTVQTYFEDQMVELLKTLKSNYPAHENLILVGGCALNCLLNSRIIRDQIYSNVFIPPFPNDEGISIGAAIALAYDRNDLKFKPIRFQEMTACLGPVDFSTQRNQHRVSEIFKAYKVHCPENLPSFVAQILEQGEIIAWMQGRSEVGPRSLGARSLLVRPDLKGVKKLLNETVKFRENFRPYGATIIHDRVQDFYEVPEGFESPFMTFSPLMRREYATQLSGIVHQDGTSRIQTLHSDQNPAFYSLLKEFEALTGLPILLNTSLNIMGQPILETIEDALLFFQSSPIKNLVYGDFVVMKC
jgi:carbamoyltransferase